MSALPYIPLYVADYLADTSHLSTLEHGSYLLLIMNYWQRGEALPSDDVKLARIARLSAKEWAAVKPAIAEFFVEQDGTWTSRRIETELQKVRDKSETRAKAGKASAHAKAKQKASKSSTHVEQKPNYTDTDTNTNGEDKSSPLRGDGFQEFWEAYPKREGNADQAGAKLAYYTVIAETNWDRIIAAAKAYAAWCDAEKKTGTPYVKSAKGWLSDGLWKEWEPKALQTVPSGYLAKPGMPQWDAWQAVKKTPISERYGGWWFTSEWPPGHPNFSEAA